MNRLNPGDRIEDLMRNNLRIIQNQALPKFNMDSILLANYPRVRAGWRVCDLCTGTGIVPLLLTTRAQNLNIVGVELLENMADLAQRSVELNKLCHEIEIVQGDLRFLGELSGQFNLVTVNPPYFRTTQGKITQDLVRAAARVQTTAGIREVVASAAQLLRPKGLLALVFRAAGLEEVLEHLQEHRIHAQRIRFIHHDTLHKASSFLLQGIKGSKTQLVIEKPLLLTDHNGEISKEMNGVYYEGTPLEGG